MPNRPLTVIAANDHPVVISGIRLLLQSEPDFVMIAETNDATGTIVAINHQVPDLLILDLWMGGNDGLELLRQIHRSWPEIRVLIYSMNDERIFGPRTLQAGAAGYLMKSRGPDEMLKALRLVATGGRYLSSNLVAGLMETALSRSQHPNHSTILTGLTDRELHILRLIGNGQTTAAIAKMLSISPKTVGAHRENLKNKLNAVNGAALTQQATLLVESRVL